jgi:amino acid adenylation domain-containing protein
VCSRHEVLRSTYHDGPSSLHGGDHRVLPPVCRQKIHPRNRLGPICCAKCLEAPCTERDRATTLAAIAEDAALTFDLGRNPPIRMTVYQLSGEEWIIHFNIHHIAIDEWGFGNVCRELESIYHALQLDDSSMSSLTEPPQYSEFSQCHQAKEAYDQRHERLERWLRSIDTESFEPFLSELHVHRPVETLTRLEEDESLIHVRTLDSKQVRLFEAKQCVGSTPFIGWLTLCQIVLARMTQRARFALAVPVTDRGMDPRFQDVVGFCLNTLLVPLELASEDTFESSLRSTRRMYDACVEGSFPLAMVFEALGNRRPATGNARLEVMFVYHDFDGSVGMSGLPLRFLQDAEHLQLASVGHRFDLVVNYSIMHTETPQLTFEYRQSLFNREFVEAMARSFEAALSDIVAHGNQKPYGQINCLSAIDEARILEWSAPPPLSELMETTWVRGDGLLLHQLVESMARKVPQAAAVVTKLGYALTYGELVAKARALCRRLQKNGLTHQMSVLLFLNRSAELVVAELAVLIGRGVFVILDPQHKIAVNRAKAETAHPGMVVVDSTTTSAWGSLRPEGDVHSVNLSEPVDVAPVQADSGASASGDAYLCFTSGSTGDAKCFPISHAAAAASIMSHVERFQLRTGDRVGMVCSTTFDVSILETFAALAAGATLCIASQDEALTDLAHTLATLEVTHVFSTPTLISLLDGPAQVPSLRFVALLGEPTVAKLFELWVRSVDLRNAYGPAEMAMNTHSRRFSATDDITRVGQRIGTTMPSVRAHVLDLKGNLTLPGCVGHLHISAREPGRLGHLSRGYISPTSANTRFTHHPRFGKLFNTGDLVFYTFDGELNFFGRGDDQVKLHGVRMNLGDIERAVQRSTDQPIAAVLCNMSESSTPEQALVLFVHVRNPERVSHEEQRDLPCSWLRPLSPVVQEALRELRRRAAEQLMDLMVPRFWLPVRGLPRSDNGKVDRKVLKSWAVEFSSHEHSGKGEYATLSLRPSRGSRADGARADSDRVLGKRLPPPKGQDRPRHNILARRRRQHFRNSIRL